MASIVMRLVHAISGMLRWLWSIPRELRVRRDALELQRMIYGRRDDNEDER